MVDDNDIRMYTTMLGELLTSLIPHYERLATLAAIRGFESEIAAFWRRECAHLEQYIHALKCINIDDADSVSRFCNDIAGATKFVCTIAHISFKMLESKGFAWLLEELDAISDQLVRTARCLHVGEEDDNLVH